MATTSEGKCCDAVLRILEEQHKAPRSDVVRDTAARRGVEVVCNIGGQRYAIEHTLIEPFPENQKDNIAFGRVFDNTLEAEIRETLRPEFAYNVDVDVYAFASMNGKQLARVRQAFIAWLREAIPKLPVPSEYPQTSIRAEPPVVPVAVRLSCHRSTGLGGRLLPGRFAPPELEDLRRMRLLKALQDKSPKLHVAKLSGTRTVLVLENSDIALTNESLVSETINDLAQHVSHMPDDTYIVDTGIREHFYVTQVRRQGHMCLDVGPEPGRWEFKAEDLKEI